MKRRSFEGMECSVARALDVVGDPWTLLVVREALFDTRRFDDFQRALDIPRNTLASRLELLVDHGVLVRRPYEEHPPRHEYVLTDKGRALHPVVVALLQWGDRWSGQEPPITLVDATTGVDLDLAYVDRTTGRTMDEIHVARRTNR